MSGKNGYNRQGPIHVPLESEAVVNGLLLGKTGAQTKAGHGENRWIGVRRLKEVVRAGVDDDHDKLWERVVSDLGIPLEGLQFLFDALYFAPQYAGEEPGDVLNEAQPCTAAELCRGILGFAKDTFGGEYAAILRSWGLHTSEKVGSVVYALIERGLMRPNDGDERNNFDRQFDLTNTLPNGCICKAYRSQTAS
jgi:uncharacterized repeat protein (TIGR04138 family)